MQEIIQIQLRTAGEIKYFLTNNMKLEVGDKVIVEADRGLEYGEVVAQAEKVTESGSLEQPLQIVYQPGQYCSLKVLHGSSHSFSSLIGPSNPLLIGSGVRRSVIAGAPRNVFGYVAIPH